MLLYVKRSQKQLLNNALAVSFDGFGKGAMLGGKSGCGRASEEVGFRNLMFGLRLLSRTLSMRSPTNFVVCDVKTFFNIHCLDFLQYT